MCCEDIYPADWRVSFPPSCDIATAWGILNSTLICNGSWDHFIWNLVELHRLLSERPSEFNYLYVTKFLKARAAHLAMNGPFSSCQVTVLGGIARYKLQFAAIYRFLFMFGLERALAQHVTAPGLGLNEGQLFRVDIGMIEKTYIEILEVISLLPDAETLLHGYKIGDWVAASLPVDGKPPVSLVPPAVPVPVDIEETGIYRKVKPAPTELALKILAHDRIRYVRERHGPETACDLELERLCAWEKVGGYPLIKCGDEYIEYYGMTVHDKKTTLYLVCADCTMRLMHAGVSFPGCRPREIYLGWPAEAREACSLATEVEYLVEFDNGTADVFRVSFRGHRENEKPDVPRCLWARADSERRGPRDGEAVRGLRQLAVCSEGEAAACCLDKRGVDQRGLRQLAVGSDERGMRQLAVCSEGAVGCASGTHGTHGTDEHGKASAGPAKVIGDFKVIRVAGVDVDLSKKHKARGFVRFVHGQIAGKVTREFYAEEMRDAFNAQAPVNKPGRRWMSDRLREDLFKGMEKDFDLLVETLDKPSGHYRLKF